VVAALWLAHLEWAQKSEHDSNADTHKSDKATFKTIDANIDDLTHRVIVMETIQACRDGTRNCK
jgi:hypothetical protein